MLCVGVLAATRTHVLASQAWASVRGIVTSPVAQLVPSCDDSSRPNLSARKPLRVAMRSVKNPATFLQLL